MGWEVASIVGIVSDGTGITSVVGLFRIQDLNSALFTYLLLIRYSHKEMNE